MVDCRPSEGSYQVDGPRIANARTRRWREMYDVLGEAGNSYQCLRMIQVSRNRHDAFRAQPGKTILGVGKRVSTPAASQRFGQAQADISASDD